MHSIGFSGRRQIAQAMSKGYRAEPPFDCRQTMISALFVDKLGESLGTCREPIVMFPSTPFDKSCEVRGVTTDSTR